MVPKAMAVVVAAVAAAPLFAGAADLRVSTPAFADHGAIPSRYTCRGAGISPPLRLEGVPSRTRSLALIMDDPDAPAGVWVHWLAWNIDPRVKEIPENTLPAGAVEGRNSWGKSSYGGPCPPSGTHRYFFRVYALDTALPLHRAADRAQLERAMRGHILAGGGLVGTCTATSER